MTTAPGTEPIDTTLDVVNKLGLHARACGKLIEVTARHRCDIRIGRGDNLVDAKNIMHLLMLGAGKRHHPPPRRQRLRPRQSPYRNP